MLYEGTNPIVSVIGVENVFWNAETLDIAPREYSALAFRIKGEAIITNKGENFEINTNDILYLPQNMPYKAEYTDTEILVIHFKTLIDDKRIEVYTLKNCEEVYKLFMQAHNLWKNKELGYEVFEMSILYKILGKIFEGETKTKLPKHFLKAVSLINSKFTDSSISISQICKEVGIGETVFRQLFKTHFQKSPLRYITELRLEQARNLISCGVSIEMSAIESGFNDPKYFSRVVKKQFGCTPRELKVYGK